MALGSADVGERSITVLVVEDEILVRLAVADSLRSEGFIVLEAATGDEAKALLATFAEIAVVFSDIQTPGATDGVALAAFLRTAYPNVGILLTSGTVMRPDTDKSVAFLAKPYHPHDVVMRVRDLAK